MTKSSRTILIVVAFLFICGFLLPPGNPSGTAFPSKDFLHMKGTVVTHIVKNSTDTLSENRILELQDDDGMTLWFGRYFYKDICVTGICRMVKLWIFWDCAGNYLGIQLDEKDPLTKSDHTPFEPEDYIRLDQILADTLSILKSLRYEDLVTDEITQPELDDNRNLMALFEVDGYSSATSPTLKEYVVKDAVYTCYTLWHTVYGETKVNIDDILKGRIDSNYLNKLLNGSENQKLFALEIIRQNSSFFFEFNSQLLPLIASQNKNISEKALSVVTPQYLSNSENQLRFIELMDHSLPETKYEIIYKLQLIDNISTDAIILLIDKYTTGKISAGGLNQIFKIISKRIVTNKNILNNNEIESRLVQLSKHSDPYTANLTKNFLKSTR
jgi:hypothetical protein